MQKGIWMKFARVFDVARYGQIVMIKKQNDAGAPELRFYCQPEGFGVCSFAIGWDDDSGENKVSEAFDKLLMREVIEICDGYFKHMAAAEQRH
jgi:hypothetical protein